MPKPDDDMRVRLPGLFRWSELVELLAEPEPDDEWRFVVMLHSLTPDREALYEVHGWQRRFENTAVSIESSHARRIQNRTTSAARK